MWRSLRPSGIRRVSYLVVRGLVGIGILHFRIRSVLPLFSCVKVLRARCTSKCNNIYFLHEGVEAEKAVGVVSFGAVGFGVITSSVAIIGTVVFKVVWPTQPFGVPPARA